MINCYKHWIYQGTYTIGVFIMYYKIKFDHFENEQLRYEKSSDAKTD